MRKITALILAMVLVAGLLTGCASSGPSAADLDAAKAELDTTKSELDATKAELDSVKAQLDEALSAEFDPAQIIDWYNESDLWRTVKTGAWSTDPADQISDEELEKIFSMASKQQTAVQWSNSFFIVIKDPEEQRNAMVAADADNRDVFVGEGTVTILVLEDQNLTEEQGRASAYREKSNWYFQNPWPFHNSGLQSATLGIAAAALGYYTHYYAGVNGPTAVADLADGKYKSMSYFVKDEYIRAMGVGYQYGEEPNDESLYPVAGNCVLIGAIVVGKPPADEPLETWATNYGRPYNYAIWDND